METADRPKIKTPLAIRLYTYFDLLMERFDFEIASWEQHDGDSPAPTWDARVPQDFRDFFTTVKEARFMFAATEEVELGQLGISLSSDCMNFLEPPSWVPEIEGTTGKVESWTQLDWVEGWDGKGSYFAIETGGTSIRFGFEDLGYFRDLESYLTIGARRCFVYGWQIDKWEYHQESKLADRAIAIAKLREGSMDAATPPAKVVAALVRAGKARGMGHALAQDRVELTAEIANDMILWLGADATFLLPSDA